MPLGYNRVLGDPRKSPESRPHRVALAGWPTVMQDARNATLDALIGHLNASGYEGVEFSTHSFARYFPGDSPSVIATKARRAMEAGGLQIFGATLHLGDSQLRQMGWLPGVIDQMKTIQDMGGEFASFQFEVAPEYYNTGGLYRENEEYLRWCADTVGTLRENAWKLGLNFYLEVHVDRITEDPAALCRILDMADVELNGDLSHFLSRGFLKGKHVDRIVDRVNHAHVRMARKYGDLSADVPDPKADWEQQGVTWQLFQLMKPALAHGLSSRTISGETGGMHLVKDTLTLDAKLVPLWRAMARYADAGAQGIAMKVEQPADLKPWG